MQLNFTDKESYFAWRKEWKATLAVKIADLRAARINFRDAMAGYNRHTVHYHSLMDALSNRNTALREVHKLMDLNHKAKQESQKQYLAVKEKKVIEETKNRVDERLHRYLPIRVVIRKHADGKIEGQVEHSFSMGWDDKRVNIYWSGTAYSILGEHQLDGIKWAQNNWTKRDPDLFTPEEFVIDPLAADSPIEIDWERWLNATNKFDKRNAHFKLRSK